MPALVTIAGVDSNKRQEETCRCAFRCTAFQHRVAFAPQFINPFEIFKITNFQPTNQSEPLLDWMTGRGAKEIHTTLKSLS